MLRLPCFKSPKEGLAQVICYLLEILHSITLILVSFIFIVSQCFTLILSIAYIIFSAYSVLLQLYLIPQAAIKFLFCTSDLNFLLHLT
jgi:hypothetical protein